MTGTAAAVWALLAAGLCLGIAATCLALAVTAVGDRPAQLAHAVTGVGMAGMFSPWGDPVPVAAGVAVFAVVGAGFAARALRGGGTDSGATHVAISSAAMCVMYLLHHHGGHPAPGAPATGAHAGHAPTGGAADLVVMSVVLVTAGYFVWHAWTCTHWARSPRTAPSTDTVARATRARVEPLAHGAMSVLMAAMSLGAV